MNSESFSPGQMVTKPSTAKQIHLCIALAFLAFVSFLDATTPFDREWSNLYFVFTIYVGLVFRGWTEITLYSISIMIAIAIPMLIRTSEFWMQVGMVNRSIGVTFGLILIGLIRIRRRYLDALQAGKSELEQKVIARTAELEARNMALRQEMAERQRAEQAWRESESPFRLLFEGANDAIFWADAETSLLTHCNPAAEAMVGRKRSELIGKPQSILHPEEDSHKYLELFRRHSLENSKSPVEAEVIRKDGQRVVVSIAPSVTMIGTQKIVQGIFHDITERKRIDEELRISRQRLEALSRQLITTQEAERRHLARELHDQIGQVLTAIKMSLHRSQQEADSDLQSCLTANARMVDDAISQVRCLTLSLRPPQLDELGLVAALHWLIKHQSFAGNCEVHLEVDLANSRVPAEMEIVCFRIAQEALTNAVRHAGPVNLWVKLWVNDDHLHLAVQDDGSGFNVEQSLVQALNGDSVGLISMQERASLVGGHLEIESIENQGTRIHAQFPLRVKHGE